MRVVILTTTSPKSMPFDHFRSMMPGLRERCEFSVVFLRKMFVNRETAMLATHVWSDVHDDWVDEPVASLFELGPIDERLLLGGTGRENGFTYTEIGDIRRAERIIVHVGGLHKILEWYLFERLTATNPRAEIIVSRKTSLPGLLHLPFALFGNDALTPETFLVGKGGGIAEPDIRHVGSMRALSASEENRRPDVEFLQGADGETTREVLKLYIQRRLGSDAATVPFEVFDPDAREDYPYIGMTAGIALTLSGSRPDSKSPYTLADYVLTHEEWLSYGHTLLGRRWNSRSRTDSGFAFNRTTILAMDRLRASDLHRSDLHRKLEAWSEKGLAHSRLEIDEYVGAFASEWNRFAKSTESAAVDAPHDVQRVNFGRKPVSAIAGSGG